MKVYIVEAPGKVFKTFHHKQKSNNILHFIRIQTSKLKLNYFHTYELIVLFVKIKNKKKLKKKVR